MHTQTLIAFTELHDYFLSQGLLSHKHSGYRRDRIINLHQMLSDGNALISEHQLQQSYSRFSFHFPSWVRQGWFIFSHAILLEAPPTSGMGEPRGGRIPKVVYEMVEGGLLAHQPPLFDERMGTFCNLVFLALLERRSRIRTATLDMQATWFDLLFENPLEWHGDLADEWVEELDLFAPTDLVWLARLAKKNKPASHVKFWEPLKSESC